ncbi:MAG: hypothetical protein LQ351_005987 [Letrouitia transgressa]|nr:MAG: hypothetical protein LQ351_005987 [Letrouitia transgressa]
MGICSSCLGLGRRRTSAEDPEITRLLSSDPYRLRYGSSIQPPPRPAFQPDPEHVRRENEALESIAHGMSEDVVDIFTVLPEGSGEGRRIREEQLAIKGLHSLAKKDRLANHTPAKNGIEQDELEGQAMLYRSIKKTHLDRIMRPLDDRENEWSNQS